MLDDVRQNMVGEFKPIFTSAFPSHKEGLEDKIVGLYLRGLDVHEIGVKLIRCGGGDISANLISEVIEKRSPLADIILSLYEDEDLGVLEIQDQLEKRHGQGIYVWTISSQLAERFEMEIPAGLIREVTMALVYKEPLFGNALAIWKSELGALYPNIAQRMNDSGSSLDCVEQTL
jgi:hypothetical protein